VQVWGIYLRKDRYSRQKHVWTAAVPDAGRKKDGEKDTDKENERKGRREGEEREREKERFVVAFMQLSPSSD